jgi:endonuclease-3 related protein
MRKQNLMDIYTKLLTAIGPRHWWPAESAEEVIFGAILTQNTAWKNVEQAIAALRQAGKLGFKQVAALDAQTLAGLIRPARFLNQKAKALKAFADYFGKTCTFSIQRMRQKKTGPLREELLGLYRIGPETADSILLYALGKPVFVIDAYTKRIFSRHGWLSMEHPYEDFQNLFMDSLPRNAALYNEYHALLVHVGNRFCRPRPLCEQCPLQELYRQRVKRKL